MENNGPGSPGYRFEKLAEFAETEFGHSPLSSRPFELTIKEGVIKLKSDNHVYRVMLESIAKTLQCPGGLKEIEAKKLSHIITLGIEGK